MRHAIGRLWCVVVGHRGVKVITNGRMLGMDASGAAKFEITGHRWDCSRCGTRGARMAGAR